MRQLTFAIAVFMLVMVPVDKQVSAAPPVIAAAVTVATGAYVGYLAGMTAGISRGLRLHFYPAPDYRFRELLHGIH